MGEPTATLAEPTGALRKLCALSDIEDGKAAEFQMELEGGPRMIFAVRNGDDVRVFLNWCPHMGRPLNYYPSRFLLASEGEIFCAFHFARFRIDDGYCVDGPCRSQSLAAIPFRIEAGEILIGETIAWSDPK